MQRDELAVDVGEADLVVVKHVEIAYPRARKRLGGKAAHSADAEYGNASAGKRLHRLLAKQELRTGKFIEHGCVRLSSCAAKKSTSKS